MAYTYKYTQQDWGTERICRVYDGDREIAIGDPFWPAGIPVDPGRRQRRLLQWVRESIQHYEREVK